MIAFLSALMLQAVSAPPEAPSPNAEPPCTPQNADRTEVTAITQSPLDFLGRCVTVSGPASGISLYSGVEGLYLTQRFGPDGNIPSAGLRHRIGVYAEDNAIRLASRAWRGPATLTVTGRVDTCEAMKARAEQAARAAGQIPIIMMGGYCHYHSGPVVRAASHEVDTSVRYERLVGEAARRQFGNLVAAPADWPTRPLLLALAEEFRAALIAGDRHKLADLHDFGPGSTNPSDAKLLDFLLDPGSPFAEIRDARSTALMLFIFNSQTSPKGYAEATRNPGGTVCFCRTRNCSESWPISLSDAANRADRPFVCTKIEPRDWTSRKAGFHTSIGTSGLAEPAKTAFHRD